MYKIYGEYISENFIGDIQPIPLRRLYGREAIGKIGKKRRFVGKTRE